MSRAVLPAALGAWVALGASMGSALAETAEIEELEGLLKAGRFTEVEESTARLLAEAEATAGPRSLQVAEILDVHVESLWRGMKADRRALDLAERALEIRAEALGSSHIDLSASLDNLGHVCRVSGDYPRARAVFERGLTIRESTLGPDHPDIAISLNQLGWVQYKLGEFEAAGESFRRSAEIREATLGPDHPDVATTLNNHAILLRHTGDYSAARQIFERVLTIYLENLDEDHPKVSSAINNLAIVLKYLGDYAEAKSLYEKALRIRKKSLSPNHPVIAANLNNLAALHTEMGNYPKAKRLYEDALKLLEKALGPEHEDVASTLNNLGVLLCDSGNCRRAKPLFERSLSIREKLDPEHPLVAQVLGNLGPLYEELGRFEESRAAHERALSIQKASFGEDHPEVASTQENLAGFLHRQGNLGAARRLLDEALATYRRHLGTDHPEIAGCLLSLSALFLDMGDGPGALDLALQADAIGREHLLLTARTLPEGQALAYASVRPAGLNLALSILAGGGPEVDETAGLVWDAVIRDRALVLDEMKVRQGVASLVEGPAEELSRASERLANVLVRGVAGMTVAENRRVLDAAREERDRAEEALAEASLSFRRRNRAAGTGLREVAAMLPPGAALLAYVRYERKTAVPAAGSYLAFLLRPGETEPLAIPLGPADELDDLVRGWKDRILAARGKLPAMLRSEEGRYLRASEELRRAVWDPVAVYLDGATHVMVVPDGALHLVNLSTLGNGEGGYLIESAPPISYLSAERDLVRHREGDPEGEGILVVGGPDFDHAEGDSPAVRAKPSAPGTSPSDCTDFGSRRFAPLAGARREAETIASLWNDAAADGGEMRVTALLGGDATERAVKRQAPGHKVVHFATHGFFVETRCRDSGPRRPVQDLAPTLEDDPVVVSGLALASANLRHGSRNVRGDGILTSEEIAAMDLTDVEWVVLSACETGTGKIRTGEGVFGLRRAFEIAGSESLIMSLWSVDDAWTREWMRELYEARLLGSSTVQAVQRAAREVLRQRRAKTRSGHPFYWGAFIASGSWR